MVGPNDRDRSSSCRLNRPEEDNPQGRGLEVFETHNTLRVATSRKSEILPVFRSTALLQKNDDLKLSPEAAHMKTLFGVRPLSLLLSLAAAFAFISISRAAPADQGTLLVLNKSDSTLAIIDPATLKVLARVPTGEAPHEVTTSGDGRFAFVSNYGTADRPGNTISVIDIAASAAMSTATLHRHFRAELGCTPHQWLTNVRIEHARRLLEQTHLAVDQVAHRSGLGTASNLRNRLAAHTGLTPSAYRRSFGRQP